MATSTDRPRGKETSPSAPPAASPGQSRPPEQPAPSGRVGRLAPTKAMLRRVVAVVAVAALAVVAVVLVVGVLLKGQPPATGAAELVPGNALVYVHLSTDPSRDAVRQGLAVSRRLPDSPLLFAAVTNRLDTLLSGSSNALVDFAKQVRPWLGKEAAFAVLDTTSSSAGSLIVLDVRDRARARGFLASQLIQPDGRFRGVALMRQPSGAELAFVGHYLVLGQKASVESAIFVAAGGAPSLAKDPSYQAAAGDEPSDRVLDAYASAAGIRRALLPRGGVLGGLAVLLDQPALSATAISVSPTGTGLGVIVHSALDPKLVRRLGASPVQISPTLAGALPAGSTLLLDLRDFPHAASKLLTAAATAGVAGRFGALLSRLGSGLAAEGVSVRPVLSIFRGETAVALVPTSGGSPAPVIVTRTSHPAAAQARLAELLAPLTQLFTPPGSGPGQAPEVNNFPLAGITVHQVALAPGFQLDYTVAHGLVVVSTSADGVAGVIAHRRALTDAPAYGATLGDHPDQVTSLLFSALPQLLRLGEQTGLINSSRLATLWPDLAKVRAVGLASTRGELETTSEISLQIR